MEKGETIDQMIVRMQQNKIAKTQTVLQGGLITEDLSVITALLQYENEQLRNKWKFAKFGLMYFSKIC